MIFYVFLLLSCLQVLYDRLKLDKHLPKTTLYKTAKGQEMSTKEGMLNQLVPYHALPSIVLNHRQVNCVSCLFTYAITCLLG